MWTGLAISVNGESLLLDSSGAAFWPAQATLMFADLHLEKGSSYARGRQFLPPYDTHATLLRMVAAITRFNPKRIVALGDSFHDKDAAERLPAEARNLLAALKRRVHLDRRQPRSPSSGLAGRHGDGGMVGRRAELPP